ncbi:HIT family protein [Devosia sp. Root635]|uniref:HIT family protein n=1 Tax=Devosia sp. Root635 TaxID=1736575 RepID=UPI0007005791|nr:HIT domain-containing protein [Devosia sp. Root635]KRA45614.1 cell-cycle regulation histidine triad HIT protein [Devosia sp. Root635]
MTSAAGCRFCLDNRLLADAPLFANDTCYFLESIDPVLTHAGMIVPFRHSDSPFDLTADEWRDAFELLHRARVHLSPAAPDGYTIGWNVGAAAGQTVAHTHLHIVARFGDEPLAGLGLRHHLKQPSNRRPQRDRE